MRVGYVRVSSIDQSLERQLDGLDVEKVFQDKASGKSTNRPGLTECMDFLRSGDTLVVHSIDRLARNLFDLQAIVQKLTGKGVGIHFKKESLTFAASGEGSPMDKMLLHILGAFAEFERAMIRERQREGISVAKKQGRRLGRPAALTAEQKDALVTRCKAGEQKAALAKEYGISRTLLYQILQEGKAAA